MNIIYHGGKKLIKVGEVRREKALSPRFAQVPSFVQVQGLLKSTAYHSVHLPVYRLVEKLTFYHVSQMLANMPANIG